MSANILFGQGEPLKKIIGEYQMILNNDVTYNAAKELVVTQAKIKALRDEFGEIVIQGNSTYLHSTSNNEMNESNQLFTMIADSYVNGEWVKNRKDPVVVRLPSNDRGEVWIKANVTGYGRSLKRNLQSFEFKFFSELLNTHESKSLFSENENFKISFVSSKRGYLYVFMDDFKEQSTSLIFPLDKTLTGVESKNLVSANSPFVLFDKGSNNAPYEIITFKDKTLTEEVLKIYFIFSPDTPLLLPIQNKNSMGLDDVYDNFSLLTFSSMPMTNFQSWLHTLRSKNKNVEYNWATITIR